MQETARTFTLDELCSLVELPRRTVRYYIQIGLVDRPEGAGRGAHYAAHHLEKLLEIRKWQQAGLSLERIGELIGGEADAGPIPPPRPRRPGTVEVRSHIVLGDGIELSIDPQRAGLSPEALRELAREAAALCERLKED